jgi:hypothetical protein
MIKMIKGTYGLKVDGVVEAMTPHSTPFSLTEKREDELVAAGVAVKVEEPVQATAYADMKMAELRKAAAALGVDASAAKTKSEVIALIEGAEAAKAEDDAGETAGE